MTASRRILTLPNGITAVRLALLPWFSWLFLTGAEDRLAILVLGVIGISDWLDGFLARRMGSVSELGKLLDPISDRIAVVVIAGSLLVRGVIPLAAGVAVLARDALVAIVFPLLEASGIPRIPVNRVGKAATGSLYFGMGLAVLGTVAGSAVRSAGVAFVWFGAGLYWLAAVFYASEATRLMKAPR